MAILVEPLLIARRVLREQDSLASAVYLKNGSRNIQTDCLDFPHDWLLL
jgi:hypothetical protein